MFQSFMSAIALQALQLALCQFFGFCINQEDCPDGVCDDLLKAVDELGDDAPQAVVSSGRTMAFNFNPDWTRIKPLVDAAMAFVNELRLFLGINSKVG